MVIRIFEKKDEVDLRTKEQKKFESQMKWKKRVDTVFGFVRENKDVLICVVPPVTAAIAGTTKVASKLIGAHTVNKELKDQERRIYDHSLGRYTYLRRPLRPAEALTIEERRAAGEKLNMILQDMGLLKK